jgi:hypothetical protein
VKGKGAEFFDLLSPRMQDLVNDFEFPLAPTMRHNRAVWLSAPHVERRGDLNSYYSCTYVIDVERIGESYIARGYSRASLDEAVQLCQTQYETILRKSQLQLIDSAQCEPCATCGDLTSMRGTRRCNDCYEVEGRLGDYLRSERGQLFVLKALTNRAKQGILPPEK